MTSKIVRQLLKTIVLCVQIGIVFVFVAVGYKIWTILYWKDIRQFSSTQATSATEQDIVITSLASVDLIWVKDSKGKWRTPEEMSTPFLQSTFPKSKGFCVHSYEVGFGYEDLGTMAKAMAKESMDNREIPGPDILTVNTTSSQNAPDSILVDCQSFNTIQNRESRDDQILRVLDNDGVLVEHQLHGMQGLANLLDMSDKACFEPGRAIGSSKCWINVLLRQLEEQTNELEQEAQEFTAQIAEFQPDDAAAPIGEGPKDERSMEDVANELAVLMNTLAVNGDGNQAASVPPNPEKIKALEAELGSLIGNDRVNGRIRAIRDGATAGSNVVAFQVTFSTIAGVSEKRRAWVFFKASAFHLQRDVSRVLYGSPLSPKPKTAQRGWFEEPVIVLEVPTPDVIAIDRTTQTLVTKGKLKDTESDDETMTLSAYLNAQILESLRGGIERLHPFAVASAQEILQRRLQRMNPDIDEIRFVDSRIVSADQHVLRRLDNLLRELE